MAIPRDTGILRTCRPCRENLAFGFRWPDYDYGARRQIERELAKMDPENFFVLEVEAVNVR